MQAIKLLWLYRDYHGFRRASNYNKAGKCPGRSYGESACCKRCQQRDKGLSAMVEYYTGVAARLTQAASIPEDLTDNELDEVLNAKTSFNKEL
jgi:hypothetical protein